MGAIEPLLGIVDMKNATGLVLRSGEVPSLLPASARSTLTMPPLSDAMFDVLLAELLSPEQRARLVADGTLEHVYESPAYGSFAIRAASSGEKLTVTMTKGGRRATAAEAPRAQPPPAPAPPSRPAQRAEPPAAAPPAPPSTEPIARPTVALSHEAAAHFDAVLEQAVERRASDVLFSTGSIPLLRVDGELIECAGAAPMRADEIEAWFAPHVGAERQPVFEMSGSVDFAFRYASAQTAEATRFRGNLFRHASGVAVALRPIASAIPTLSDLNLPSTLSQLVDQRHGLLVFTGATGSGKSTTLAALLDHINRTRAAHIVTLEDPIEFVYTRRRAIIHQREVGRDVDTFASGLRAALRESPDVLLVGEMRDPETIRLTLTAAQTGHLVLTTLHSGDAIGAIDRIVDGFPESEKSHVRQELAGSLRHVVAQRLVPAIAGGRLPALEIVTVTHAVAAQIRDGRTHMVATQLETGAEEGMIPMARALATLVRTGRVARAAALAVSGDRTILEKLLEERPGARPRLT